VQGRHGNCRVWRSGREEVTAPAVLFGAAYFATICRTSETKT